MSSLADQINAFLAKPRSMCPDVATATSDGKNSISLSVEFSKDKLLLLIETEKSGAFSAMVLGNNTITRIDGRQTVADLIRDVVATLRDRLSLQMEIAHTTSHCDSWDQVDMHTPTMSFGVGGTITGGGSVPSAHHPDIQTLLTKYEKSKEVISNLTQRRPLFIFRLNISDLHPTTLMAWGLKGQKALTVSISLHPTEFLNVPPMIEIDIEGGSDDVERSRSNVVSHLQHIANHFARSISEEYQKSTSIVGCAIAILKAKSNDRINKWADASGNDHKKVLSTSGDVVEVLNTFL